jgi:acyl-coenzyme A synthetase/AMP-(fatty) acid ligase
VELTAARFSGEPGNRTYRTGDRVVDDGAGELRFVGRTDGQVKRRGYRVELGDIEAALLRDPSVGDAAVIAVPDDAVTNRLIAIVEAAPGATPVSVDVIRHLSTLLPPSMLPDRVDVVVRLARTSTGKLDRTRLAADAARD